MGKTIFFLGILFVLGGVFYSLFVQQPKNQSESQVDVPVPQDVVVEPGTIMQEASNAGILTTFVKAVETAGLADTLSNQGPFTVFAPSDEAFAQLPPATLESLLADVESLTKVLTYHVVSGQVTAADIITLDTITTMNGQEIAIELGDIGVRLNELATATQLDKFASNGVIHVIDAVLMPE